ncbi:MAG: hypothetical protein PSV46_16625 [Reyranella sp.]|nr:hypothetical protein [Reyranella sp.]
MTVSQTLDTGRQLRRRKPALSGAELFVLAEWRRKKHHPVSHGPASTAADLEGANKDLIDMR